MCEIRRSSCAGWIAAVLLVFAASSWGGDALAAEDPGRALENSARAEEREPGPLEIAVYWENDSTPLHPTWNEDRHYTNGVGLKIARQPAWARGLVELMPFNREFESKHGGQRTAGGVLAGQLMFTPQDIAEEDLIRDDRPYAGYLFGGVFWQRANPEHTTLDHFQLEIGVVGPASQADHTQNIIHDWTGTVDPQGWRNQLGDEVTGQFRFSKKWRIRPGQPDYTADAARKRRWAWEILPQAGFDLGTVQRNVSADVTVRGGWNLPDDFGPDQLQDVGAATGLRDRGFGFYGFARLGGRVVEHDIFIEGNNFDQSHGVEPEPLVGEAQIGAEIRYGAADWSAELMYGQTYLTREFKTQNEHDSFASLTLSIIVLF